MPTAIRALALPLLLTLAVVGGSIDINGGFSRVDPQTGFPEDWNWEGAEGGATYTLQNGVLTIKAGEKGASFCGKRAAIPEFRRGLVLRFEADIRGHGGVGFRVYDGNGQCIHSSHKPEQFDTGFQRSVYTELLLPEYSGKPASSFVLCAFAGVNGETAFRALNAAVTDPNPQALSAVEVRLPEAALQHERTAADELADYLTRRTGAYVRVRAESAPPVSEMIFVGNTAAALAAQVDRATMGPEQWRVLTTPPGLVINGGSPRGVIYGVYDYLENHCGVRFWTLGEETVPTSAAVPLRGLDAAGRPAIEHREVYSLYAADGGRFAAQLRVTSMIEDYYGQRRAPYDFGMQAIFGPPDFSHTFEFYISKAEYFGTHPEFFVLKDGKRDAGPGPKNAYQLCLSDHELRRIFSEKLRAYIRRGRAEADALHLAWPRLYDISQNDNGTKCECAGCRALAAKYGGESGIVIDFVNDIADSIRDEFPEVLVNTFAYIHTQEPPQGLAARPNVCVTMVDTASNLLYAYSEQVNTSFYRQLRGWAQVAANLRVWIYGITYAKPQGLPFPSEFSYGEILRFYHGNNVKWVFFEFENPILGDTWDYKLWLWCRLCGNPAADVQQLLDEFADGYYGAAGRHFAAYRRLLRESAAKRSSFIGNYAVPGQFNFLDYDTVDRANTLFAQGEAALAGRPDLLRRWHHARMPVDRTILHRARLLMRDYYSQHKTLDGYPLDRKAAAERVAAAVAEQTAWRANLIAGISTRAQQAYDEEKGSYLSEIHVKSLLPPQRFAPLEGRYQDYLAETAFRFIDMGKLVADEAAESGTTCRYPMKKETSKSMCWGLWSPSGATFTVAHDSVPWEQLSESEYRWYKLVDASVLTEDAVLYFFPSWNVQFPVGGACRPLRPETQYEIWGSLRAYPPNEDGSQDVGLERVVVIPVTEMAR